MNSAKDKAQKNMPKVKDYNAFVHQVEISNIRIISSRVDLLDYSYFPSSSEVTIKATEWYDNSAELFSISQKYNLNILDKETKKSKARISVTFCLAYNSRIPMSDDYFEIFRQRNLPLNTWPYFREFVHNTVMRMGWPPFIAPKYSI